MPVFDTFRRVGGAQRPVREYGLAIAAVLVDVALFSRLFEDQSRTSWVTSDANAAVIVLASAPAVPVLAMRRKRPASTSIGLAIYAALLTLLLGTRPLLMLLIALYTASALTPRRVGLICLGCTLLAHSMAVAYEAYNIFVDDRLGVVLVAAFYIVCDIAAWGIGQLSARARQREAYLEEERAIMAAVARGRRDAMERARSLRDPHVFISYRSDDTGHAAGRLGEQLVQRLGSDRVFIDVVSIDPGDDFRVSIADAVAHTAIMLVLIGRSWIRASDGRRRLADPSDVLRIEIEEALLMQVHIVPVLVDDAAMPSLADLPEPLWPLSRRNAVRLRARMFRQDVEELLEMVAEYIDQRRSVAE